MKTILTNYQVMERAHNLVAPIVEAGVMNCYPIPRGGVPVSYLLTRIPGISIVETPEEADFFVDDIIDSGATMEYYCGNYPGKPFLALVDKRSNDADRELGWVVFPWENSNEESSEEDIVRRMLQFIGEDVTREGLLETPKRVLKAWRELYSGYSQDPAQVMKVFEDGAEKMDDEMVIVRNIPFYSNCEHHLLPIMGTATIAYIPDGKIIGLSKLPRLLDVFARRAQVQERLTTQVAESLMEHLKPKGVAVLIKARHLCMESRGINKSSTETITSALRGVFKDEHSARAEFMALAKD